MILEKIFKLLDEHIIINDYYTDYLSNKNKFFVCTHDSFCEYKDLYADIFMIIHYLKKMQLMQKKRTLYVVGGVPLSSKNKIYSLLKFIENFTNIKYIDVFNESNNVEKISNLLSKEKNVDVFMFIERKKFKTSSGLFYIYNLIKDSCVDIVNISLLDGEMDPSLIKNGFVYSQIIAIFKILSNKWTLTSKKFEPFSYRDKDEFMKKYYKLLYN
jgi:hypothetical protein